jgi:hypothetical protein
MNPAIRWILSIVIAIKAKSKALSELGSALQLRA